VPVDDPEAAESGELRDLRRFEEQAFPRMGSLLPRGAEPDDSARPLPPGLTGRWGGSGDLPRELRSPETPRSAEQGGQTRPTWLSSLEMPELPVRWEPQVLRYLEFFKSDPKGRAIMTSWLRKMERFRAIIERTLDRNQLPRDIIYLAMVESGFEPGATSNKSAGGVWQFMPGVARAYGVDVSFWVDQRRDPERASESAARFLKDLYVRFGSWHLAFAAYNAGYGAVLRSIARYNTNDYWELCRHEAGLPWETTLYVPKIIAAAIVGHNRRAFGFADVPSDPPWTFDTVEVPAGTALTSLARAAGARPEVMEALNPELVRGRTPPDRGPSAVRIPAGSAELFTQAVSTVRSAGDRFEPMLLRFGETLDDVARARGVNPRELRRINGVSDTSELRGGTTILVPTKPGTPVATTTEEDDTILVAVPDRVSHTEGREAVFYRTRDGDTLEEVADAFSVSVDNLLEWNNIDAAAKLQPRLVLRVFVRKDFDRAGVMLLDPDKLRVVTLGSEEFLALEAARRGKTRLQYTARPGDTLAKIAKRYGLSPGDLARINRLSATTELGDGQKIIVYSPTPTLPREITSSPSGKPVLAKNTPAPALGKVGKGTGKQMAMTAPSRPGLNKASAHPAPGKSAPVKGVKPGTPAKSNVPIKKPAGKR
jgi:membrane-bound lytic murein transglycosylase D